MTRPVCSVLLLPPPSPVTSLLLSDLSALSSIDAMPPPAPELPSDLAVEVLLRLPVKSLVRFKSVCKSWRSLIESPAFISEHLNRSIGESGNVARSLLVEHVGPTASEGRASVLSGETLELTASAEIPPFLHSRRWKVVGSSNGLLCLSYQQCPMYAELELLFLWNPATRESRVLPKCGIVSRKRWVLTIEFVARHGFGYDRVTDDYKIVRVAMKSCKGKKKLRVRAEVFALSEGVWREIPVLYRGVYSSKCVAIDGVLYWIVRSCDADELETVVSFHLRDEVFREVHLPRLGRGCKLTVLEGSLCAMMYSLRGCATRLDLWVMEGGTGEEYWTKRLSIETTDEINIPLGCGVNGEVLVEKCHGRHSASVAVYEASQNAFRELPITGPLFNIDCHFYVESLVPVNR